MARIASSSFISPPPSLSRLRERPPSQLDLSCLHVNNLGPMDRCPVEILILIFSCLPPLDIVRGRVVSRDWKSIIDASTLLKYIVELYIDRMVDNFDCAAHPSERLSALRSRRRAWGGSVLTAAKKFTILPGREYRRTLDHGVLTRLVDTGNGNLVLAQQNISCHDKYIGKGRSDTSIRTYESLRQEVGVPGGNLWDIHQDLWILVDPTLQGCIKVHTLTTGGSHPTAAVSKLVVPGSIAAGGNMELHLLGIHGPYFAVNLTAPIPNTNQYDIAEYVLVWNWQTSFLASVVPIPDSASTRQHAFHFLSEEHFVICTDEECPPDSISDSVVIMKAYGIPNSVAQQHNFDAHHLATFGFPSGHSSQLKLDPTWRYEAMGTPPAPPAPTALQQKPQQKRFFSEAPDSFLIVIPVVLEAGDYDEGEGFFVTHATTVLTHLPSHTSSSPMTRVRALDTSTSSSRSPSVLSPSAPVHIPWEAWGVKGARFFPYDSSRIVAASGERLMRWERLPISDKKNANPNRPMGFVLYDFNQARLRRTQLSTASGTTCASGSRTLAGTKKGLWPPAEDSPSSFVLDSTSPSAMRNAAKDGMTLFDADVGGLPCSRMKWTLDVVASGAAKVRDVLMDESHILIMLGKSEASTECIAYTL